MVGIPPSLDSDAEDVVWALQTAASLWKRNERVDAIVWLRRAAQAAGEAQDDDRALVLARGAAELAEWIAHASSPALTPSGAPVDGTASSPPASASAVDDLLRSSQVDIEEAPDVEVPSQPAIEIAARSVAEPPMSALPMSGEPLSLTSPEVLAVEFAPPRAEPEADLGATRVDPTRPPPPPTRPPPHSAAPIPQAADLEATREVEPRDATDIAEAPSAAQAHAGMLDPWAEGESRKEARHIPSPVPIAPPPEPEEVVTSAAPLEKISSMPRVAAVSAVEAVPLPPPDITPPMPAATSARPPPPLPPRSGKGAPPRPPVKPAVPKPPAPKPAMITPQARASANANAAALAGMPEAPPVAHEVDDQSPTPIAPAVAAGVPPDDAATPIAPAVASAAPIVAQPPPAPGLDLGAVEAFSDLPDDAREEFARAARVLDLKREEEVSSFALAFVIDGAFDVAAQIVDAPAERLAKGAVLRSRGTLEDSVPMRLLCASDTATVATWTDAAVEAAFHSCPWVEDDLRAAGDRIQALVGVTMGPLGERLDPYLRAQVTSRLILKLLAGGEVFAMEGKPVPGLLLVGAGEVELMRDDKVTGTARPGEFVFASEVLGASSAPATARACANGAIVFVADRMIAQELMVTCPPLLEIFAGM